MVSGFIRISEKELLLIHDIPEIVLLTCLWFYDNGDEFPDLKTWYNQIVNIELKDLTYIEQLGVGNFGRSHLVKDKRTAKVYVLRKISKARTVERNHQHLVINEKRVLTMLNSPFCLKLHATFKTKTHLYFLNEYIPGGELFTVLRWNKKFGIKPARFYTGCIILALEYLHSMDIICRDIKPENLLIASNGYLKLIDFGFSKKAHQAKEATCTISGSPAYMTPEQINANAPTFAVDWWLLGCVLYEMSFGYPPFQDDPVMKTYEKILKVEPEFPDDVDLDLKDLIQKLLIKNPDKRLNAIIDANDQILIKQHPFFQCIPTLFNWQDLFDQKIKPPYKPNIEEEIENDGDFDIAQFTNSSDDETLTDVDLKWADKF